MEDAVDAFARRHDRLAIGEIAAHDFDAVRRQFRIHRRARSSAHRIAAGDSCFDDIARPETRRRR